MIYSIPAVSIFYAGFNYGSIFKAPDLLASFLPNKEDEKISKLIAEHGLPDHTHILEFDTLSLAGAMGTCLKTPVIAFSNHFKKFEEGTQNFVLLHEIGHLKHEDLLTGTTVMTAAVCAFDVYSSVFSLKALGTLTALSAIFATIAERRADSYARSHVSNDDLVSARRFFIARDQAKGEMHQKETSLSDRVLSSLSWFHYHILTGHPLNQTRLSYIDSELASRGVLVADPTDQELEKVEYTKNLILQTEIGNEEMKVIEDQKAAAAA